ncbi:MAG: hypothetical protein IKO01_12585 [Kiritimatiellae bacterium]|nr:hypothetical protein [Kiritimatiellia bacterium]
MNAIKSLFSSSDASDVKGMRTYVVDGGRLMDEKTGRRMSPREQVQLLNALARVAKQENLDIQVVLESDKRLREVDEADQYNGIGVHFAKDSDELVDTAMRLCKKGRNGVMVSSAPNLESKAMQAGFTVLCSATFRKAFLAGGIGGGNGGRGDRDRRGGNGGGRDRRRDRGGRRNGGNGNGNGGSTGNGGEPAPAPAGDAPAESAAPEANPVSNLIDLVE